MPPQQKVNVLLVDDQPNNLTALEAVLSGSDRNLIRASSGEEALKCLLRDEFAVIILDVHMPGLDGFETAAVIREREKTRDTPIIFLTAAHREEIHVSLGYSLGAVDYMMKPFEPAILRSKVAVFVELFKKTQEVTRQAQQLAETTAFLNSVLEGSTEYSIIAQDMNGVILAWNEGARRMFGYSAEEMVGKHNARILYHDEKTTVDRFEQMLRTVEQQGMAEGEFQGQQKNGHLFAAQVTVTQRQGASGMPIGYVVIAKDITEEKSLKEQIQRKNAELEHRSTELAATNDKLRTTNQDLMTAGLELRQAETRYRTLVEHIPATTYITQLGEQASTIYISPQVETMLGFTPDEWMADPHRWEHQLHPDDRDRLLAEVAQKRAQGEGFTAEYRMLTHRGGIMWCRDEAVVARDEAGKPQFVQGFWVNITERKQAEEERVQFIREQAARAEAEAAQQRFAFLAHASKELSSSLDYEATLRRVAQLAVPKLADICTVSILEEDGTICQLAVVGANSHGDTSSDQLMRFPATSQGNGPLAKVMSTGKPQLYPEVPPWLKSTRGSDGGALPLGDSAAMRSLMVVPLLARGRMLGTIAFVLVEQDRDYTPVDLSLAEELAGRAALAVDNARLYRDLQRSIRTREEFLAAAAHDLKNPLASIKGGAQLLQRHVARATTLNSNRLATGLAGIDAATTQMVALIDELLDVARLQMGRPLDLYRTTIDMVDVVKQASEGHQRSTDRHHIVVTASEEHLTGDWDRARLERVLDNLLSNAIKYSPTGGDILLEIHRESQSDGEWAVVTVRDSGIGIPVKDLPRIFEQFHRGENVIGKIRGTGIGLAGAQQIVDQHGGTITVTSEEGNGSTFSMRLPVAAPPERPSINGAAQPHGDDASQG